MAAAMALSLASAVQAAEQNTRVTTRDRSITTQTSISHNDRDFGQVERWSQLKGNEILGSDNQKLGKLEDVVVDLESGHILYAIVGSGGVLGAGEKKFAVAPGAFTDTSGKNIHFNGDKAKLNGAPEFTKEMDKNTESGKTAFVNTVHKYFGQTAWWQGANDASAGQFNNVHKVSDLMSKNIKNVNDEDMGKVDNVMLNLPTGRVAFLVLSPASSLALGGNNLYALPPNAFSLNKDGKSLTSDISKEKLAGAPHFDKNNWTQTSDPTWASQVYQYYGKEAYFQSTGKLQPTGRSSDKKDKN